MGFELPNGKTARNLQDQVKFLSEKLKELYAAVNEIGIRVLVVDELPEEGASATIYLVPSEDPDQENIYNEYMWIEDAWELIGSTAIDLSDYMTLSTDQTVSGKKTIQNVSLDFSHTSSPDTLFSIYTADYGALDIKRNTTTQIEIGNNNIFFRNVLPLSSSNNLGLQNVKWNDLYLSGKAYIGSHTSIYESADTTYIYNDAGNPILVNGAIRPLITNAKDLGSSTLSWKDLYLSGDIKFSGTSSQGIYNSNFSRWIIRYDSGNGVVDTNYTFCPLASNSYDLGLSYRMWKNLYLSGNLSDGTNTVSVAQIASGIGGTYRHVIYIEGATADMTIAVNLNSATAITTQAAFAAINNNVMGGTATLDTQSTYKIVAIDSVGNVGSITYLDETGQHTLNIVDIYQDVVNQI